MNNRDRRRLKSIQGFILTGFLTVGLKLVDLQILRHPGLLERAQNQVQRIEQTPVKRGMIVDRDKQVLAESVQNAALCADPSQISNTQTVSIRLASMLGLSPGDLINKLSSSRSFVWLERSVSCDLAKKAATVDPGAVFSLPEYGRFYPNERLASAILGFVGVDGRGLSGIEAAFNDILIGRGTITRCWRDGRGHIVAERAGNPGEDLVHVALTVNRQIQYIAEKELEEAVSRTKSKSGMVIVQDPSTGEILAMASNPAPALDPNHHQTPNNLNVPPVTAVFEPGSTFKLVTAAAVLEEGAVKPNELWDGEKGHWKLFDATIHDHEPQGLMTFTQVFERSSNIGTAKIALRLGSQRLFRYARAFGFGASPGSGLPGEARGLLKTPREWSGLSCAMISFGQEVGVTALQVVDAYSAVANGGILMQPQIVKNLFKNSGAVLWKEEPVPVRRVISEKTALKLRKILTGVVERGTGTLAKVSGFTVAGKTGTAQKIDPTTGKYSNAKMTVSFCGFLPAENPRVTILVVLDEPSGLSWGGTDAAPVFRRIAQQIMPLLNVFPDTIPEGTSRASLKT
jgi:cell division protein FtsI (penicillin-binding protein 3)